MAFDEPFALVLNLAVGGERAGEPRNRDRFPQRMIVDFVKVSVAEGDDEAPPASTPPTTEPTDPPATEPPVTTPADDASQHGTADHTADHGHRRPLRSGSRSRST